MTDPIADMLTRLRNASAAKHETVDMPYSKFKANIAEILISKPGLRRYAKSDSLPMPLGGLGIAIISTSSGLLTQKECLDRGIGGEIVAFVW